MLLIILIFYLAKLISYLVRLVSGRDFFLRLQLLYFILHVWTQTACRTTVCACVESISSICRYFGFAGLTPVRHTPHTRPPGSILAAATHQGAEFGLVRLRYQTFPNKICQTAFSSNYLQNKIFPPPQKLLFKHHVYVCFQLAQAGHESQPFECPPPPPGHATASCPQDR